MFKDSPIAGLKKMFLIILNVTLNRICDMLVNREMTFKCA